MEHRRSVLNAIHNGLVQMDREQERRVEGPPTATLETDTDHGDYDNVTEEDSNGADMNGDSENDGDDLNDDNVENVTEEDANGADVNGDGENNGDDLDDPNWAYAKCKILASKSKKKGSRVSKSYPLFRALCEYLEGRLKGEVDEQTSLAKVHDISKKKEQLIDLFLYTAEFDENGNVKKNEHGLFCVYEYDVKAMDGSKAFVIPFDPNQYFHEDNLFVATFLENKLTQLYKSNRKLSRTRGLEQFRKQFKFHTGDFANGNLICNDRCYERARSRRYTTSSAPAATNSILDIDESIDEYVNRRTLQTTCDLSNRDKRGCSTICQVNE